MLRRTTALFATTHALQPTALFATTQAPQPTPAVEAALEAQLGYVPPNFVDVAAWNGDAPAVIRAYPLLRRKGGVEPFPTMLWLTCPEIAAAVATLERDGGVKAAAADILGNEEGAAALEKAHESYAAKRWALLSDEDRALVEARGWADKLRDVGVAGIQRRGAQSIKCLHAHYAHYLGDPEGANPVGAWIHVRISR